MNLKNSTQRIELGGRNQVTETAAEPEAEQEEADQMRDTDEGWGNWSRAQRKKWKEKEAKKQSKKK